MTGEDPVADLLQRWEEAKERGRDIPVEELCGGRPELEAPVREGIEALKKVDWLNRPSGRSAASQPPALSVRPPPKAPRSESEP